jgi:hypothetical protein
MWIQNETWGTAIQLEGPIKYNKRIQPKLADGIFPNTKENTKNQHSSKQIQIAWKLRKEVPTHKRISRAPVELKTNPNTKWWEEQEFKGIKDKMIFITTVTQTYSIINLNSSN